MNILRSRAAASRLVGATIAVLATLAIVGAPANAAKAPIGANGVINACYKAKGKGKGIVRVVPAGKKCKAKKGEKPIAWTATGTPGAQGPKGDQGPAGTATANGTDDLLTLITEQILRIDSLTTTIDDLLGQVGLLEGVLAGVSNGELLGALSALEGITNGDLQGLLGTMPDVCDQLSVLTGQTNALRTVIGGLGLNGVLTALGGLLDIPALPAALDPFNCPA